ncbi:uncharacterized protein F5147DRAFT_194580 [Suillus discolor]|uniref:Uncharacterized protein n=1 Tax=Suillus discolor TaxID=1912936 RepID=A0A9P7K025_9AGAM|nr:uncharacterized protein F5147DRAFT_194580 [Suillus discolor]KAG2118987.1 hypothetical protein F5147DRAFT_194580 [Suillus discolor]
MPVPVPTRQPAHPVHKYSKTEDASKSHSSVFHNLKHTLPVSPTGPPPSFGSRDQWINSLPSWRRTKTRRIWEDDARSTSEERRERDFYQGLTSTADVQVSKGNHAEACLPPLNAFPQKCALNTSPSDVDQPMHAERRTSAYASVWGTESYDSPDNSSTHDYVWPRFAPVLEDDSDDMMNGDFGSSPIGPMTPFTEYVDRVIATSAGTTVSDQIPLRQDNSYQYGLHSYNMVDYQYTDQIKQESVASVDSPPSASMKYKMFAEPMADWIVSYVWKVCKNSIVLPPAVSRYTPAMSGQQPAPTAPMHLSASVHSLLMSTLLQPSAVLLAMWYIARLPVYFSGVTSGLGVKERKFSAELLDTTGGIDGKTLEANATFRLIVLGFMLANKWLDDHTFSNKTWHTICKLPVHSLNKLESLALDILSHDLTISPAAWRQWLGHMFSYHVSLSPPPYAQPISRPSSNPQSIVRKVIEEIMEAPLAHPSSEPVFISFEQRSKTELNRAETCTEASQEAYDIDLDEDGPLREEYLPKRRVSNGSAASRHSSQQASRVEVERRELRDSATGQNWNALPPPSKWSPAADEPIHRGSDRPALYMPVQPPAVCWAPAITYVPVKVAPDYSSVPYSKLAAPSNDYCYSQSVIAQQPSQPRCNADSFSPPNSGYSYPIGFDYQCGHVRMSFDGAGYPSQPMTNSNWLSTEAYAFPAPRVLFGPHPSINYQSSWVRA